MGPISKRDPSRFKKGRISNLASFCFKIKEISIMFREKTVGGGRHSIRNMTPIEFERWASMKVNKTDTSFFRTVADAKAAIKSMRPTSYKAEPKMVLIHGGYLSNGIYQYRRVYQIEDAMGIVSRGEWFRT
jgi:hypothetical protein